MKTYKKPILFSIAVLAIVASSYTILRVLQPVLQTENILSQTSPSPVSTEKYSSATAISSPQTAAVEYRFSPADLKKYLLPLDSPLFDSVENKQDGKAQFFVNVIYAIDKDTVFLGGILGFSNNESFGRSILLRSSDGGKHWTEVMQTARVSEVEHILFLDQGAGWALVEGSGEVGSVMPTILWHTSNFGETWEIAGPISAGSPGAQGWYATLKFYNSTHGEVGFVCDASNLCGGSDYYSILSTVDGGVTWQESYHLSLPLVDGDPSFEKRLSAFILPKGGRYGSYIGGCGYLNIQDCPAYGQDGSEWRAEYSQDQMNLFVRRRLPFESEWTTYMIPSCIEYKQRKMTEACK